MAGNSRRRGAIRKEGTKKGAVVGSGGQRRRALRGKGPTPPAEMRPGHPAQKRAAAAERKATQQPGSKRRPSTDSDGPETVFGRNPVVECLRAGVPATALLVAQATSADERVSEAVRLAADAGISILEVPKIDLDRMAAGALHQGVGLTVRAFVYAHPDELLETARAARQAPLIVALDGVTDPRNLGAIVRSAAAFGAQGVLLPARRSAGITAVAWRTSAGTAARIPVARATNLTRTLREYASAGLMLAGLDAEGSVSSDDFELAGQPLVLVVGSEGKGLSRLVREQCDAIAAIPIASAVESLNAGVAAGIALYEVSRRRLPTP